MMKECLIKFIFGITYELIYTKITICKYFYLILAYYQLLAAV